MDFGDLVQMNVGQILQSVPVPHQDFRGRTVVITGANTGLGLEAAKHIYRLNASVVILACRDLYKGDAARRKILDECQTQSACKLELWHLDMSSFASVLSFGDKLKTLQRLDAFIANAAVSTNVWSTAEGWESTLTVNVISTMLLCFLSLPKLCETARMTTEPGHLCLTGTVGHIFAKGKALVKSEPIFESLNDPLTADMTDRYHLSKLLLILCFRALSEKLGKPGHMIVSYVNPGWCQTELFRTDDGGAGGRFGLWLIGRTAEVGSRTLVHAITDGPHSHGKYLSECRVKPESAFVRSKEGAAVQEKVWKEMVRILEGIRSGVTRL
ncbi:WW domain-containing oxido [Cyphellophora attinorum]|uniref:WW domain-containing oxido n=1 Tax=Cyphellophora attinorum TaxID=1664694 RepID=A0A0N1P057_9EURO|nr:WW domain-containing oxido [Phialophora attinorum]KPI43044.1 WW domain-containing oxido [Phialophora attinorum]